MSKTRKLYEVRVYEGSRYSQRIGFKLRERSRAIKVKNYLKRRGLDVFVSALTVAV